MFTTRFSGGKGGRNGFEAELRRLGVAQKNGKPGHLLDGFTAIYNHQRPHRSLPHRATPHRPTPPAPKPPTATAPSTPTTGSAPDRIDTDGKLTLRVNGRLHHIGIGMTHAQTPVLLLVHDLHIRVINAATGELLRELTLGPTRNYQPTGQPPGPKPKRPRTQ